MGFKLSGLGIFASLQISYLVPDDYVVPVRSEFVEWEHVEPGALVPGSVQVHSHRVLLEEGGQALVHCQVLVGLDVEKLKRKTTSRVNWVYGINSITLKLARRYKAGTRKDISCHCSTSARIPRAIIFSHSFLPTIFSFCPGHHHYHCQ
jgi:hypothetical protein